MTSNGFSRRDFLRTGLVAASGVWAAPFRAAAADERPPNIVLIMSDDQGFETVGAYGGEDYETPRLDELAATGMRFDHGYAQPICTPSRVKIMTGMSNVRNYKRFGVLPKDQVTFANLLRDAGYATCVVGKWQLNDPARDDPERQQEIFEIPDHFGFDEYCLWQLCMTGRSPRYASPVMEINGELERRHGAYGPDIAVEYAKDFMTRHRNEPFLLYYPMILPHWPFTPTPHSEDWDPDAEDGVEDGKYFADMIAYVDTIVGRLADHLDELGLRENTLILFTTDNGTERPDHGRWRDADSTVRWKSREVVGGKGEMTDAGTRVPFIANWPGTIPEGSVTDALVDFSDILPTLCELASVDLPEDRIIDGESLVPVLQGEADAVRDVLYMWYERGGDEDEAQQFARTHRYKLYDDGQFYDVANDLFEENPIPEEEMTEAQLAVREKLQETLDQFADQRGRWRVVDN